MWVWDSTMYAVTSKDEGGPIWTYRWETGEEDFLPPLPNDASRGERIGRVLASIVLTGFVAYLFWALPI